MDGAPNPPAAQSERLVDKIVYLASLVSDPKAIDDALDDLRLVTATHQFGTSLSTEEVAKLDTVYQKVENYLVSQDPLRAFSAEELRQKVTDKFELKSRNDSLRRALLDITGLACALGGLALMVPLPPTEDSAFEFYLLLVVPTIFTVLHFGAGWLFISALQYFRTTLKIAYRLIAGGIVVLGLAQAQLVVLGLFDLWSAPWVTIGVISIIFTLAFSLVYGGIRLVGRLFNVQTLLTSPVVVVGASLVVGALAVVSPHYPAPVEELLVDVGTTGLAITTLLAGVAASTALGIKSRISKLYQKPLGSLAVALGLMAVSGLQFLFVQLVIGYHNWYEDSGLIFVPLLLGALAFVRAGYLFNKVSNY